METICVVEANELKSRDALKQLSLDDFGKKVIEKEKNFDLEKDFDFKQVIMCAVIKYKDEYLLYKRDNKEKRLTGKWSCLIGGHARYPEKLKVLDTEDEYVLADNVDHSWFLSEMIREFKEEFKVNDNYVRGCSFKFSGYLNTDKNEVSRVHLGIVYVIEVPTRIKMQSECSDQKYCSFGALGHNLIDKGEGEVWSVTLIQVLKDIGRSDFPTNDIVDEKGRKDLNRPVFAISDYYEDEEK